MKNILFVLVAGLCLGSCATKDSKSTTTGDTTTVKKDTTATAAAPAPVADTANFTTIEWIGSPTKDLGKLKNGKEVDVVFRFRNTGNKNLVIENVSASCGCTIPEKPQQAFAPGEEGEIKAKFNGIGSGSISKNVNVTANTKPQQHHTLTFTGDIKE